jgi:hypothetical protein
VGRHHRPDSDFDQDTETWWAMPDPVRYRKGFLDGLITAWVLALVGYGVYVVITRYGYLFAAIVK